jgi:hypothetical protein
LLAAGQIDTAKLENRTQISVHFHNDRAKKFQFPTIHCQYVITMNHGDYAFMFTTKDRVFTNFLSVDSKLICDSGTKYSR